MTTTYVGSKLWITLNSNRVAEELYNRKGKLTNGRPPYPIVGDLISRSGRTILLPTEKWSPQRRLMHQLLSGSALSTYQDYQKEESLKMLARYKKIPQHWYLHHMHYSNAVIHRISFGEIPEDNDSKIRGVAKAQMMFLMNAPPHNIWDSFPALSKLPKWLQTWRKKYEIMGEESEQAYSDYWDPIAQSIHTGKAPESFARGLMSEKLVKSGEVDPKWLAMNLVEAGSDTTRLTLNIFSLAAAVCKEKFLRAREEIDSVCGDAERLPDFPDEKDMPYTLAFIKELLRWRPVFDWTPEHTLTEDLHFESYFFPKGTHFALNHAALCTDCEAPHEFRPERWLDGHQSDLTHGIWQFGGGRRVCVGHRLAQKSLFINVSRLIYCFDYKTVSCQKPGALKFTDCVILARNL